MPGSVARGLQDFGDGDFIGIQSLPVSGEKHSEVRPRRHIDPLRITPGHQSGTRWSANRGGHIKAGQSGTLRRHLIDARRADVLAAEATQVAVALVVGEDDDEVGRPLCCVRKGACEEQQNEWAGKWGQENSGQRFPAHIFLPNPKPGFIRFLTL